MGEHEYVPRLVEALVGKKVVGVSAGGGLHSSLTEAGACEADLQEGNADSGLIDIQKSVLGIIERRGSSESVGPFASNGAALLLPCQHLQEGEKTV